MTTIPSRLARITRSSSSPTESRTRVISLYRDWYRAAPFIVSIYGLSVSPALIRRRLREEVERNRYIGDVRVIDRLIAKWQLEYQETMNVWKQEPHVMGLLLQPKDTSHHKTFMEKFYSGRDDEGVVPAVSTVGSGF
ncbi:NdufA6 NADH-ubiquinone oxidoreductase 14.8 kDa subunit [Hysterangium stoloniferum]|nr:NdufA6 NADH-ubiquinone oxidoreductase 14.8 kDa subunit [Hysterangium stoloniferum]